MVFIFPMLDKVDAFFMNRGEKLRKTRPRSWKNSHGILSFWILKDLIRQNREEGGVNQWLGCCWFHVGQIGFLVSLKESIDDREGSWKSRTSSWRWNDFKELVFVWAQKKAPWLINVFHAQKRAHLFQSVWDCCFFLKKKVFFCPTKMAWDMIFVHQMLCRFCCEIMLFLSWVTGIPKKKAETSSSAPFSVVFFKHVSLLWKWF